MLTLLQADGSAPVSSIKSLKDFGDPLKLMSLRDELVEQDRCQLALAIATRAGLEQEPVLVAMGLSMLRAGKYREAKEAFWSLAESQGEDRSRWSGYLRQILIILEENHTETTFPASRYMQCVFYLKKFGTPGDMLAFWLRHNLLEDAIRYVCSHTLSSQLFLNTLIKHCASRGMLPTLQRLLVSQPRDKGRPYMEMVCDWLTAHRVWLVLLEWQLAMNDHQRASYTCLRLYQHVERLEDQKRFLLMAKQHVLASSDGESEFLRMINMQLDLFEALPQAPRRYSLWNGSEEQLEIAVELLSTKNHQMALAYRLMQEYRVPIARAYTLAALKIVKRKSTSHVKQLTQFMRGTVDDTEWDQVHEAIVKSFLDEHRDATTAASFAQEMHHPVAKVHALLACRKDREAFQAAIKSPHQQLAIQLVQHIQKFSHSNTTQKLCAKYLQEHPPPPQMS